MKPLNPSDHHQLSRIALSRRQLLGGLAGLAAASSTAQAALLFRPSQLNHLTLNVSDLERSRAFTANCSEARSGRFRLLHWIASTSVRIRWGSI